MVVHTISHSGAGRFLKCNRLAWYKDLKRLKVIGAPEDPKMAAGSIGHGALERLHSGTGIERVMEWMGDQPIPEGGPRYLTPMHMQGVVRLYNERWKHKPMQALRVGRDKLREGSIIKLQATMADDDTLVLSESTITVDLNGVPYTFIPDMICEYEGALTVVDHKFTFGTISANGVLRRLSYQLPLYLAATLRAFDLPVERGLINEIAAGSNALKSDSQDMKVSRAHDVGASDTLIDEAVQWLVTVYKRREAMRKHLQDDPAGWPKNPQWDCKRCAWLSLCERSPQLAERRIASDFDKEGDG